MLNDLLDAEIVAEGDAAGKAGKPFGACPYIFANSNVSQGEFERNWRHKLNAWSAGWMPHYRKHFKPKAIQQRKASNYTCRQ